MMNSWLVETVKRKQAHGEYIEVNPADATALGIADEQQVRLSSRTGSVVAKARLSEEVPPGVVCLEHGWGSRLFDPVEGGPAQVQGVNRNLLVDSAGVDELSGMPSLNGTAVSLQAA
jgi:formate dehydrogenase